MTDYAIVDDGVVMEYRRLAGPPEQPAGKPYRKILPVEDTMPKPGPNQKLLAPVVTVLTDKVTRVWAVRDYTPAELDSLSNSKIDAVDILMVKVAFNHENRIRALESKAPITMQQFRNALRAML